MAKVIFSYGTQAEYNAIQSKDLNTIYFITDSKRIYKGSDKLSDVGLRVVGSVPTYESALEDVLYAVVDSERIRLYIKDTSSQSIREIGTCPVDDKSTTMDGGQISLKNFGKQYYKYIYILDAVETINDLDADASEGSYCKVQDDWFVKEEDSWAIAEVFPENDDPYILVDGFISGLQPKSKEVTDGEGNTHFELAWYEPDSYTKVELDNIVQELKDTIEVSSSWGDSF